MHLKKRTTCRVCGNDKLTDVLNLGNQFLQGSFVKDDIKPPLRKVPLTLTLCDPSKAEDACGLLQLKHSVPPEILYKKYWYKSGTNSTMRSHLRDIAIEISKYEPKSIMDIGCNDGTLLHCFPDDVKRVGVDPSDSVKYVMGGVEIINKCFPCRETRQQRFDFITSIAMYYDLEAPAKFAYEVQQCLEPEGFWVFEVAYLPSMLKNNAFDNVCHEHIEYYSLAVLDQILEDVGMHVVKAEINDVNCGSLLVWASHKRSKHVPEREKLEAIREAEFDLCLDDVQTYTDFASRVGKITREIYEFLQLEHRNKKRIHIYGASTKGNTLIQATGISKFVEFAADRNPEKWGASTLGTEIKIISEKESRMLAPDYYFVLPWHFKKEFIEREKSAEYPGTFRPKLIFPLPKLEVIEL